MNNVDTIDNTPESAQPVELYEFTYGVNTFNYCTGSENLVVGGRYYKAVSISRASFTRTDNLLKGGLKVEIERESELGKLALLGLDDRVMTFRMYRADRSFLSDKVLSFSGGVTSYEVGELSVKLDIEPPTAIATRMGFTPKYMRMCRHKLFSGGCKLVRDDWTSKKPVVSHEGNVITVAWDGFLVPTAYAFVNGYVFHDGNYRKIIKAELVVDGYYNLKLTLLRPLPQVDVGIEISLTNGCDQTIERCHTFFNNIYNYGGFDFIPQKNPYMGVRIF